MDNPRTAEILGEENMALFSELLEKVRGKSVMELPPILNEFKSRLPKNVSFTPEQKDILIEEAMITMPESEKNRYKSIMKALNII